jgi:hypothetical protein
VRGQAALGVVALAAVAAPAFVGAAAALPSLTAATFVDGTPLATLMAL